MNHISPSTTRTWKQIYLEEAQRHDVTLPMMLGGSRARIIAKARHAAWRRMERELGFSRKEIAYCAGKRQESISSALNKPRSGAACG